MEGAYNVALAKVVTPSGLVAPFVRYYLLSDLFQKPLLLLSRSAQNGFNKEDLSTFDFVLPPLAEQKQIAAKLDELLAQVDTLKARLDAIPAILKKFRQSVLAAAVSGRLTEGWRAERGRDLGESTTIANLCTASFDGPFGSKLKSDDYTDSGARVVRLENIGHLKFLDDKRTYVSNEKYESLSKNSLREGDLLFSSFVDEEVRVCLLPKSPQKFINKADCFCLRVDEKFALQKFVLYSLACRSTYEKMKSQVHGATRPRINLSSLKQFEIVLPDIDEQTEIVRRVEQLFAFADQIEQRVKDAQTRVNHLTQSILAKAFRGELTADWRAQNPDLISGENSAEALLARIRAGREAAASTGKRSQKRSTTT